MYIELKGVLLFGEGFGRGGWGERGHRMADCVSDFVSNIYSVQILTLILSGRLVKDFTRGPKFYFFIGSRNVLN
jgi:hypothetical protein